MSRSLARSRKAVAIKSLKEKWEKREQSAKVKGEKEIGGSSTVTTTRQENDECPSLLPHPHHFCPPFGIPPWPSQLHVMVYSKLELQCPILSSLAGETPYLLGITKHCSGLEGHVLHLAQVGTSIDLKA